jgi:hypothetical protein
VIEKRILDKLNYTDEKGISNDKEYRKGDMHWHDGCAHSIKNTGTTEAEMILVSFSFCPSSIDVLVGIFAIPILCSAP